MLQAIAGNSARSVARVPLPGYDGPRPACRRQTGAVARASSGTYESGSCKIVSVAYRSTVKSGDGPRLRPVREQTVEVPARQGAGVTNHDVDDATLARAGLTGQVWAQREIWRRFAPMVFALLRRTLGARYDPEDLLQEVFLRVFARLATLANPAALRSFIYSFAVRVVSEEMRRHRIRSRLAVLFLRPVAEPSVPHVDFESRELLSRIQSVLDRMNARHRAVFVLRRLEGMELEEIASSLDLSLATVKRDLDKASTYITRAIHRDDRLSAGLLGSPAQTTGGLGDDRH